MCVCLCTCVHKNTHTHTHPATLKIPQQYTDIRAGESIGYVKQHVLTWTWIWRSYFWNTENRMDYTHTRNTHIDRCTIWKGWFEMDKGGFPHYPKCLCKYVPWWTYLYASSISCTFEMQLLCITKNTLANSESEVNYRWVSLEQITPSKHIYSGIQSKEKNRLL